MSDHPIHRFRAGPLIAPVALFSALAATCVFLALSPWSLAQDTHADPVQGVFTLARDFEPNPWSLPILAGGADDLAAHDWFGRGGEDEPDLETIDRSGPEDADEGRCAGFGVVETPVVAIDYEGGPFLRLYVQSAVDTTLVVISPDGETRCSDDAVGLQPLIDFIDAASGRYTVWVGTYWEGLPQPATLLVAESDEFAPAP